MVTKGPFYNLRKTVKYIKRFFCKKWPPATIEQIVENAKQYSATRTKCVGDLIFFRKFTCDRKIFENFINVEFEGKIYKAPLEYDTYLKAVYGNYMQLPPEDQRVSNHNFTAWTKEQQT